MIATISRINVGISNATNHAPEVNLAASTMSVVAPVATAPVPLTNMCQPRPVWLASCFCQCFTIPACERVNARNAPIAYSEMMLSMLPPNISRMIAVNAVSA